MIRLFKKDLKLFFQDKRSVVLTFLLPIILISLFAFAFGGVGGDQEKTPTSLLITDLDQTDASKEVIAKLDSLDGLKLIKSTIENSKEKIQTGKYAGAIIFHQGFAEKNGKEETFELLYDKAREMEIGMLQPVLIGTMMSTMGKKSVTNNIESYLDKQFGHLDQGTRNKILNDIENDSDTNVGFKAESSIKMTSIVGKDKNKNLGLIQAVAGTAILMLLFSVAGLGTSILEEKENGTIKRLLYSPLKGSTILYGKMLFAFFIAVLQLTLMFLFAWIAFGLDLTINIPALIIMITATAFAVSSFGIFLAAVSKTRQQAQSLGTLVVLIMSAIGGSMMPLFFMPAIMQKLAVFSVNYWGIQGFYDIFWRALPLSGVLPNVFVLLGIGVFMTLVSVRLFKRNVLRMVG